MLNADGGGQVRDETAEVGGPANIFEAVAPRQLVGDGDLVYRFAAVPERAAGVVDPGVLLAEEVFGLEPRRNFIDGL